MEAGKTNFVAGGASPSKERKRSRSAVARTPRYGVLNYVIQPLRRGRVVGDRTGAAAVAVEDLVSALDGLERARPDGGLLAEDALRTEPLLPAHVLHDLEHIVAHAAENDGHVA